MCGIIALLVSKLLESEGGARAPKVNTGGDELKNAV